MIVCSLVVLFMVLAGLGMTGVRSLTEAQVDALESLCDVLDRAGFHRPQGARPFVESGVVRAQIFGATVEVSMGTWGGGENSDSGPRARFVIYLPPGGLAFEVTRRGFEAPSRIDWPSVAVDFDDFGRSFMTRCSHPYGGALLARPARNAIEYLMSKCGASVAGDEIRFHVDYRRDDDLPLHQALAGLKTLLGAVATKRDDVAAALARRAHAEAGEEAGAMSLRMLLVEFPQHPETRRACDQALAGDHAAVGLVAAALDRGPRALAALKAWSAVPQHVAHRVEVIRELARNHSGSDLTEVLARALQDRSGEVAGVAVEVAGARKDVSLVAAIGRLALHADRALAQAAVTALRSIAAPACEKALIDALNSPHREVRIDGAAVLGQLGTLGAVVPLNRLADRLGSRGAVRQAARQAVSEIQARAGDAARGEVALADAGSTEGSLSVGTGPGELSSAEGL